MDSASENELARRSQKMAVDLLARAVLEGIAAQGGEAILLKGASFAEAFYGPGDPPRNSVDVDLLAPQAGLGAVAAVLGARGYTASRTRAPGDHATTWRRPGLPDVDVHDTLGGLRSPPARVWATLSRHRRPLTVAGGSIPALDLSALALHVAIHATQHGRAGGRPLADLERALARIGAADWRLAHQLAEELDGLAAFAIGLRLLPAGRLLAQGLGVPAALSAGAAARAQNATGRARLLAELSDAHELGARLRMLRWAIAPPRAVMREWYPDHHLARAYLVLRPVRMLAGAHRAIRELHVARQRARRIR